MRDIGLVLLAIAVLGGCRPAAAQTQESRATLTGRATFGFTPVDEPQSGIVLFTLHGTGFIGDECPGSTSHTREFLAMYQGTITVESDGSFTAPIAPKDPAVQTPDGCTIHRMDGVIVDQIVIEAWLPASPDGCARVCGGADCVAACAENAQWIAGRGALDWATLSSADSDELQEGSFGNLSAQIGFATPIARPEQPEG